MVSWDEVTHADVLRAIREYDRLGPEKFFAKHRFSPTLRYDLIWEKRTYPPKAILGTAYELATGRRLASGDFEGGKTWRRPDTRKPRLQYPAATTNQIELASTRTETLQSRSTRPAAQVPVS